MDILYFKYWIKHRIIIGTNYFKIKNIKYNTIKQMFVDIL